MVSGENCRMYKDMTTSIDLTLALQLRKQPETFHSIDLLSPAASGLTTPERLDPYWDRIWANGSTVTWRSYESAEAQVIAGLGALPSAHRIAEADAWRQLESPQTRKALLRFLSVLGTWRTMTAEQAETLSGSRGTSKVLSGLIAAAFRAGILELGSPAAGLIRESTSNRGILYRPSNSKAVQRILDNLTYPEWVSLTGGQKWDQGGQFDRHNVLATELGLRVAEYCDVATVVGEKLSTIDLLAGSGIGWGPLTGDTRSADLTIVRPDGLKIAVEITASTSANFSRKVERWARLLNDRPMDESGLAVVFVIAPPHGASATAVRTETYKTIAAVARRFPGTVRESIASRIGVANWTTWFPERHLVSTSFFPLSVDMPAEMVNGAMTWQQAEMLNPKTYRYSPNHLGLTAILDNMHLLWGTPVWLRDHRRAPSLIPTIMERSGVSAVPIPYSKTLRDVTPGGHVPGKGKGAVGDTKMPKRLLPYM